MALNKVEYFRKETPQLLNQVVQAEQSEFQFCYFLNEKKKNVTSCYIVKIK